MNKYLEKIALSPITTGALIGTAIGAPIGAVLGYAPTHKRNFWTGKQERELTKKERRNAAIKGAILDGATFGALGAFNGADREDVFRQRYQHSQRPYVDPDTLEKHFRDMGGAGFKTKAEATRHYKVMAGKWHPDRQGGNADKMAKLNEAWQKARAHPDFQKMASENNLIRSMYSMEKISMDIKGFNQYSKNGKKWPLVEPGTESKAEMKDWMDNGAPARK